MSKKKRNYVKNSKGKSNINEKINDKSINNINDTKKKNHQKQHKNTFLDYIKRFWDYIWHDDSFGSYIANFIFAFIVIKYIFFPTIGFVLNTDYPIVAIVSGSMEHKITKDGISEFYNVCGNMFPSVSSTQSLNLEEYWKFCGNYYENNYQMFKDNFEEFNYKNGLNIGDVMILYGKNPQDIEIGEVLVFKPQDKNCGKRSCFFLNKGPVIHRIVKKWDDNNITYFATKGDHNALSQPNFETKIPYEDVIGIGVVRVPYIGYIKIWITEIFSWLVGVFIK